MKAIAAIPTVFLALALLIPTMAQARNHRSAAVLHAFQRLHPCPSTSRKTGPCPGWVKDHVVALCDGGADAVSNLQWQTVAAARAKDRTECHHGRSVLRNRPT